MTCGGSVPLPIVSASMSSHGRKITPMMQQYLEVRRTLPPNTLLLFRLGDFYEMFDDDAREGAEVFGITLTQRNGQPMAGIPYHAADSYLQKALAAGRKVAICEQMETPKPGQLVKRSLTRILTPGTTLEDHQLDARSNHYILALHLYRSSAAAAWIDLTTGDFKICRDDSPDNLLSAFNSLRPRELLLADGALDAWRARHDLHAFVQAIDRLAESSPITSLPEFQFSVNDGARMVMDTLGVLNLDGFGIDPRHPGLGPAGALISYATDNLRARPENLKRIAEYTTGRTLLIDPATLRNLEIFRSSTGGRRGSLLAAMDGTVTAPGARLLESVLAAPTLDIPEVRRRQSCVGEFLEAPGFASELHDYLKGVRDIPRILGRLRNRLRNPRELGGIRDSLQQLPLVTAVLDGFEGEGLRHLRARIHEEPELRALLETALHAELPNQLNEGGYIADGYDAELDHLRSLTRNSKEWIAQLEAAEIQRTGIRNLRIKYNGASGYFIEVTKSNLHMVPDDYIRKQTMTNAERFYTPDLKEKENEILHAEEKSIAREEALFQDIAARVLDAADRLEATAAALAELDLFLGWARLAREWNYCRPEIDDSDAIEIESGRHPVVEQMMRAERIAGAPGHHEFVPNHTSISAAGEQIAVITGPNMAGKSTYIRQVALITLMAQVGAWVPATRCRIGMVDRIFSRVGASDELARGNSTFMVEMNETANILNNATDRSLIILDEIGRGTSTYDGLSIAWAVVEFLHGEGERGPRTLFATHYHELTQIARKCPRVANYSVAVKEWNDQIIFVREVRRGAADRSYGIQVARLAGLPESVIDRAKVILEKLESDDSSHNLLRKDFRRARNAEAHGEEPGQMELFA